MPLLPRQQIIQAGLLRSVLLEQPTLVAALRCKELALPLVSTQL
jgi:hypothetical protein